MRCETSFPGLSPSFILFSTYFLLSYLLFPSSSLFVIYHFLCARERKGSTSDDGNLSLVTNVPEKNPPNMAKNAVLL